MRMLKYAAMAGSIALATLARNVWSATLEQPTQGAWTTGRYRNLFLESGYAQPQIDAKVRSAFQQLFFGENATERLYRIQPDTSMALIDDSGRVVSEGMGYGLIIAVMMDRPDVFNKLWKFAKTYMQNTSGERQGFFAWSVEVRPPYAPVDLNPAPDAEEYIATSLFLASRRWGDSTGWFDYQEQADSVLEYMLRPDRGENMLAMVDPERRQILFSPTDVGGSYTNPSYHLPAFYRIWAAFASANTGIWNAMADSSYALLKRAEHPATGLFPEYATFDGAPKLARILSNSRGLVTWYSDTTFASDAHRVAANIAIDWAWFMKDSWAQDHTRRQLGFFAAQSGGPKAEYTLSGVPLRDSGSTSLISCNAAAVLASDRVDDSIFVQALWNAPIASGADRYRNGLLQMLALLEVSGNFKAYGSPGLSTSANGLRKAQPWFSARSSGKGILVEGVRGTLRLLEANGREVSRVQSTGSVALVPPHRGLWIVDAGPSGARSVVSAP